MVETLKPFFWRRSHVDPQAWGGCRFRTVHVWIYGGTLQLQLPDSSLEKVLFVIDKAFLMITSERWATAGCGRMWYSSWYITSYGCTFLMSAWSYINDLCIHLLCCLCVSERIVIHDTFQISLELLYCRMELTYKERFFIFFLVIHRDKWILSLSNTIFELL